MVFVGGDYPAFASTARGSDTVQQFRNKPDSPSSVDLSLARSPIPTCGERLLLPCPVQFFTP